MDKMSKSETFTGPSIVAFLSALSIALKKTGQEGTSPGRRDPFLLVEAEIKEFFDYSSVLANLNSDDVRDIGRVREILHQMYHDADFVMFDPSKETSH